MGFEINAAIDSLAKGIRDFSNYSAKAAANAVGVSAAAQAAQGSFNQASANLANSIGSDRIAQQYGYNAAQAQLANNFAMNSWAQTADWNEMMWQKAAEWNEMMMQKQMDFNAAEAQKNRDWQQKMMETSYQRAVADMEKAGLNPILAATGGGISTGSGAGTAASIGGASMGNTSMSPLSGHSASGGLLQGNQASESNYSGQMQYMGGMLGLLSAAMSGLSTAAQAASQNGVIGDIVNTFVDYMKEDSGSKTHTSKTGNTHGGSKGNYKTGPYANYYDNRIDQ